MKTHRKTLRNKNKGNMEGPIVCSHNVRHYDRGNYWEVVISFPKKENNLDQILPFPDACDIPTESSLNTQIDTTSRTNIHNLLPLVQRMPSNFLSFNKK